MPPEIRHPCAGRTLAMQRCFDAIAETGRPIGRGATLATLLVHHLVRPAGYRPIMQGDIPRSLALYQPTPEAQREWEAWRATLPPPLRRG